MLKVRYKLLKGKTVEKKWEIVVKNELIWSEAKRREKLETKNLEQKEIILNVLSWTESSMFE